MDTPKSGAAAPGQQLRQLLVAVREEERGASEQDETDHRAVMQVKSREAGGQGYANADVVFTLSDGGGTVHTAAQISGKAASMGEGVVVSVLDGLIKDLMVRTL